MTKFMTAKYANLILRVKSLAGTPYRRGYLVMAAGVAMIFAGLYGPWDILPGLWIAICGWAVAGLGWIPCHAVPAWRRRQRQKDHGKRKVQ